MGIAPDLKIFHLESEVIIFPFVSPAFMMDISKGRKEEDLMRKVTSFLAVILSSALVFSLAACTNPGSNNESSGSDTAIPSAEAESPAADAGKNQEAAGPEGKITITYWTQNRHDQEYMTPLIEEFNKTNQDNIYIDYQIYSDNYPQMLDLSFSTGSSPDIFLIPDGNLNNMVEKNYAMDMAPFITEEYKARFGEGAFVEGINSYGDRIYSLPYTASAVRLFYNQDIFDRVGITEPPKSLEELVTAANLITEQLADEGIYGMAANYKGGNAVRRTIDPVVMVSGGTRGGFDYRTGTYDFSSYKPVLLAFREMFAGGAAFPGSESLDIDPLRTQFAAGRIGMYMSLSHAEPGVYQSQFPTDINWNCAQVPAIGGEVMGKQQLWSGGSSFCMNQNTANPEAGWKVMEFLHSDEVMSGYHTAGLGTVMIPTAVAAAEPPETVKKMPELGLTGNDQNWPALPPNIVVEGKTYTTVCTEVIFGVTDVDAAIVDLNKRYNEAYDKAVASGQERIVYPNFTPAGQNVSK